MLSNKELHLCPHCNKAGNQSALSFIKYGALTFLKCPNTNCIYNHEGHHIVSKTQNAPISKTHVMQLGAPITLLKERLAKRKHLQMLSWMKKMKIGIYEWFAMHCNNMIQSSLNKHLEGKYKLPDEVRKLMSLQVRDIKVYKHIIPDLEKIIITLGRIYEAYVEGDLEKSTIKVSDLHIN